MALYAVPAAILLFITFLALARLIALRARADVLVDGHWLSALARAQRRMGFKHGTALSPVTSCLADQLGTDAPGDPAQHPRRRSSGRSRSDHRARACPRRSHGLGQAAARPRRDRPVLVQPAVWLLAREAHQLREEAADDAVLAADIADTDYAQLLVGVARHECPGLLLGAHGVAPSSNSLARRVARVLDGKSVRGPVARSFALGVFAGAVLIAAPLAALTLTPGGSSKKASANAVAPAGIGKPYYAASQPPTDLPHIIASGVSTSVATVAAAVAPEKAEAVQSAREQSVAAGLAAADQAREQALANAGNATRQARQAVKVSVMANGHIDQVIEMRAAGVDAGYVYALRVVQPRLRDVDPASFAGMKSIGVTPEYARELAAAGLRNLDANQLAEARAIGLSGAYVRGLAAAGIPLSVDDYVQLHAVGVPINYIHDIRRSGYSVADPDKVIQMWAVGVRPEDLKVAKPPQVPRPPVPPPNVDTPDEPDDG